MTFTTERCEAPKNKPWYRPIAHLTIIAVGTLFIVVSLVGVFVPSG
jgi:hypothetical protein